MWYYIFEKYSQYFSLLHEVIQTVYKYMYIRITCTCTYRSHEHVHTDHMDMYRQFTSIHTDSSQVPFC